MYTILLDKDKSLVCTHRETVMQRSKLADKLLFLVPCEFGGYDLGEFQTLLEYILPISRKYTAELLTKLDKPYEDKYYQYILEADTDITAENGNVELQLSFIDVTTGGDGSIKTVALKTKAHKLPITPLADWAQYASDSNLTKIDQRISEIAAAQKSLVYTQEELVRKQAEIIDDNKVSDKTTYSSKKIEKLTAGSGKDEVDGGEFDDVGGDVYDGGEF